MSSSILIARFLILICSKKLCCQLRKENICKVRIFQKNVCESLIDLYWDYLYSAKKMNLIKDSKRRYKNHKLLSSGSKAVAANSFFLTNTTYLVMRKALAVVYDLYLSSQFLILILTLLKVRKGIFKRTFILVSANRKVFSKERNFLSLLFT